MGRKPLKIDRDEVIKLARNGNTVRDIARMLGCSHDVIERRYHTELQMGWAKDRTAMNALLRDEAYNKRTPRMIEILSNRVLGPVESKIELSGNAEKPLELLIGAMTEEQMDARIKQLLSSNDEDE